MLITLNIVETNDMFNDDISCRGANCTDGRFVCLFVYNGKPGLRLHQCMCGMAVYNERIHSRYP
jgi:hypothetical protein